MLQLRGATLLVAAVTLTQTTPADFDLAICDARIVDGSGTVTERGTVLISAGRIRQITTTGSTARARRTIQASGRTLIPGLIDAHVHVTPWALDLFLAYGVTTVRDLHNDPAVTLPLAREDGPARPRVIAVGTMLDGPGTFWPNATVVDDVGETRAAVRELVGQGAGAIKVYTRLSPSLVAVAVREAGARGVPVAAHLGKTTAIEAANAGVASIEHLTGIPEAVSKDRARLVKAHDDFFQGWTAFELEWPTLSETALLRVARHLRDRGVVLVPTLALHDAFARLADPALLTNPALAGVPDTVRHDEWDAADLMRRAGWSQSTLDGFAATVPVLQRFVAMFVRMGGKVAAGTDTPQQFVVPGDSLHRELELYVAGGLSPAEALQTATVNAAELLDIGERVGRIAEGYDADLVLLEGDPLADIGATRRIAAVIRGGVEVQR
jgi:imidazolonepropionase-like amidohydrolase